MEGGFGVVEGVARCRHCSVYTHDLQFLAAFEVTRLSMEQSECYK